MPAGGVKTTRLRKCACPGCGYVARISRSWLQHGLPGCPCGKRLLPTDLDDILEAEASGHVTADELTTHAEYQCYHRNVCSVLHGQAGPARKYGADHLRSPDEIAVERVHQLRALEAHEARHAALAAHAFGGAKTPDPMPF